jgi:dolichol-phosphate mannosyltransferase
MIHEAEISVVIPVYNNDASLRELTTRLITSLISCTESYEILYVNDGSKDNSLAILREIAAEIHEIKVINLSRNFGQHPAICAGFEHASGSIIILMDADLQDNPEDIVKLVTKFQSQDSDIIYTIKQPKDGRLSSSLTSMLYHYIFASIVNTRVPLNIGTFRAFNRKFLKALLEFREVNILYGPLMFFMGFKSDFIELSFNERPHGKSAYTFKKRLQLAVNSLISYTDVPHKLSMMLGSILLLGSLLYGMVVILQYLLFGASLPGGTTLVLIVLCLTLGSVMMSLGVIGSYIFRVYQEVLRRPRYLVQEKINLK